MVRNHQSLASKPYSFSCHSHGVLCANIDARFSPVTIVSTKGVENSLINFFKRIFFTWNECRTGEMFTICVLLLLKINEELFALFGMKQIVLSYPQTDDVNESMSKTIKTFLNKYCIDHPNDWDEHLSAIAYAFNLTNLVCEGSSSFDLCPTKCLQSCMLNLLAFGSYVNRCQIKTPLISKCSTVTHVFLILLIYVWKETTVVLPKYLKQLKNSVKHWKKRKPQIAR